MKEKNIIRLAVLVFWTCFWGLSVMDKIIPDVHYLWVERISMHYHKILCISRIEESILQPLHLPAFQHLKYSTSFST